MDNQSDEYKAVINRAYHFLAVLQSFRGFISSLIGFFIFTEDDKLKAGIAGNKGDG